MSTTPTTKTIQTRIKNRIDTYAAWKGTSSLLDGEIALVRVPTGETYINPVTGKDEPAWNLLMKVGDGNTPFDTLPWLSAKAADVYDWAKNEHAKDIKVAVITGKDADGKDIVDENTTLGAWLNKVADNATGIAANTDAIVVLNGDDADVGSVKYAIKTAIDALDFADTSATKDNAEAEEKNAFVTVVTQADGKIAVTKREIAEIDLPDISSDKVYVKTGEGDATASLTNKLSAMDAAIAEKADAHDHNDYINQNAFSHIAVSGQDDVEADEVSDTVTFAGSNVSITTNKDTDTITFSVANASATEAGIVTLGAAGGAATYDSIFGTDGKGGINAQVETNTADIANIKTAIEGGIHFVGITTTELSDGSTTQTIKLPKANDDGTASEVDYTAADGDVVLYKKNVGTPETPKYLTEREFIWTGECWGELGDVTRIGALEAKLDGLDVKETNVVANTHMFVSQVTQENGKVSVTYDLPTSADVAYELNDDGTMKTSVSTKLDAIDTALAQKADKDHDHGNITNDGKLDTADIVVVTDSNNNIAASGITTTELNYLDGVTSNIQDQLNAKGTSNLTIGTTADTAAAGNHKHDDDYANKQDFVAVSANYVRFEANDGDDTTGKLYVGATDTENVIIFDCGGAGGYN